MKVAIIGSGFAGLLMGVKLKEAGIHDFTIYEKEKSLGGTWHVNTYPGCACDVQSHLYSFSFELNPNWSRTFSDQNEIWQYLEFCADKYKLRPHIKFRTAVREAIFDEKEEVWHITTEAGDTDRVQILVTATGGLSIPSYPDIKGLNEFQGARFHTAEWDNNYDFTGKNVAVIGTGASAIQLVPQITPGSKQVYLFQRTPPWVLPKPDRPFRAFEKALFRRVPGWMRFYRLALYWSKEVLAINFLYPSRAGKIGAWIAKHHIRKQVKNPEIRKKLLPDYNIGCKRVLLANDYYPAFNRYNLQLVTTGIDRIETHNIVTTDGKKYPVDVVILATGFKATEYLSNVHIVGKDVKVLYDVWQDGGEAYKGTVVSGFPNLFMFTGPNTGLGHTSVVIMMEAQVTYIMDCLKKMRNGRYKSVDVKKRVQTSYNNKLQDKMSKTVWQKGGCVSWYQDQETGKNVTLWPGFTWKYHLMMRNFDQENYEIHME